MATSVHADTDTDEAEMRKKRDNKLKAVFVKRVRRILAKRGLIKIIILKIVLKFSENITFAAFI